MRLILIEKKRVKIIKFLGKLGKSDHEIFFIYETTYGNNSLTDNKGLKRFRKVQ